MKTSLIMPVLGALVASALAAAPASAAAWVPAPPLTGVGPVADVALARNPVWVDPVSHEIRTATLQDDKTWSAPRTLAHPAGTPTLVTGDLDAYADGTPLAYTVGASLFVVDSPSLTPTPVSTSVVPGTVSWQNGHYLLWAETVAGLERVMQYDIDGVHEVRAAEATHYYDVALTVDGPDDTHPVWGWVAGPDPAGARAWTQDKGRAPVQVSTAATREIAFPGALGTLVSWTQADPGGSAVYAARRSAFGSAWGSPTKISTTSPLAGATPSEVDVQRTLTETRIHWREDGPGGWAVRQAVTSGGAWTTQTLDSGTGTLGASAYADGRAWCAPVAGGCEVRGPRPDGTAAYDVLGSSSDTDAHLAEGWTPFRQTSSQLVTWSDGPDLRFAALDATAGWPGFSLTLRRLTMSGTANAQWTSQDDWSQVASYWVRTSDWTFGTRPRLVGSSTDPATTQTSRALRVRDGHTVCLSIRVNDTAGNTSGTGRSCVVAPRDDRSLDRSRGWRAIRDRGSFHSTLLRASARGARLGFSATPDTQLSIVFRRTPGSGRVVVDYARGHSRVIDLSGPSARRVVRKVRGGSGRPVRVRVVSHGKPVFIDGLVVDGGSLTIR